jgi:hypothetical protein
MENLFKERIFLKDLYNYEDQNIFIIRSATGWYFKSRSTGRH